MKTTSIETGVSFDLLVELMLRKDGDTIPVEINIHRDEKIHDLQMMLASHMLSVFQWNSDSFPHKKGSLHEIVSFINNSNDYLPAFIRR